MAKKKPAAAKLDEPATYHSLRVLPSDYALLGELARQDDRSLAGQMTRLIREEARRRGLPVVVPE
jgi:hypothetical protein